MNPPAEERPPSGRRDFHHDAAAGGGGGRHRQRPLPEAERGGAGGAACAGGEPARQARQRGLPIRITPTHIIPFMVGDSARCTLLSEMLLRDYAIYLQPINYPTVPRGTERLRSTHSPLHTEAMKDVLADALAEIAERLALGVAA